MRGIYGGAAAEVDTYTMKELKKIHGSVSNELVETPFNSARNLNGDNSDIYNLLRHYSTELWLPEHYNPTAVLAQARAHPNITKKLRALKALESGPVGSWSG